MLFTDLFFTCPAAQPRVPRRFMNSQTVDQTKALIVQLESAYLQIMTSQSVRVFVDQNGERLEFATANADKLKALIERLYATLPDYKADIVPPIRFFF